MGPLAAHLVDMTENLDPIERDRQAWSLAASLHAYDTMDGDFAYVRDTIREQYFERALAMVSLGWTLPSATSVEPATEAPAKDHFMPWSSRALAETLVKAATDLATWRQMGWAGQSAAIDRVQSVLAERSEAAARRT